MVGHMLKGLPQVHLTLWLLRDICCADNDHLLSLPGRVRANVSVHNKGLPAMLERMGKLVFSRGYTKQCHFCLCISWFCFIYLGLEWLGIQLVFTNLLYQLLWNPIFITRLQVILLSLMCHFYWQHHPSHKYFDLWNVEHSLSLEESLTLASFLKNLKLVWKTVTLSSLVMARYCSDATLLYIDNQNFFFSITLLFLFLHLVMRWIDQVIFHLKFILNCIQC